MSGFHRQRLRQLRRAAGLDPMPAFLRDYGHMLVDDEERDYIDARYFSPEALHWADEVTEYRALGGALSAEDEECFARVWRAQRQGRKPSDAASREFHTRRKWGAAARRIPELFALEMKRRGVSPYGPDYALPDGIKGPGSGQQLIYKYLHVELGYKTPESAKANYSVWKRGRKTRPLVRTSP